MRDLFPPRGVTFWLLGALLMGPAPARAGQDVTPKGGAAAAADARFRSPRATVRTFLIAMNRAEDDPHRIDEAVACLDLAAIPLQRPHGGRIAFDLEYILRSTNIPTIVIPDAVDGPECTVGEGKDVKLTLRRQADGRWLFDGETLRDLPKMRLALWQKAVAAGQGKDAGDAPSAFRSPYALLHTFREAIKNGDLDTAATCLDLADVPDPARRIVGRGLALKLSEVLDRTVFVILQDVPDTSVGVPWRRWCTRRGGSSRSGSPPGSARGSGSSTGPRSVPWTGSTTPSGRNPCSPRWWRRAGRPAGPGSGSRPACGSATGCPAG